MSSSGPAALATCALSCLLLGPASCASGGDASTYVGDLADDGGPAVSVDGGEEGSAQQDGGGGADAPTPEADAAPAPEASPPDAAPAPSEAGPEAGLPESGVPEGSTACAHPTTGALVTFDLSSQTGSETTVAPTTSVAGVTGGALTRAPALVAASGSGSINSSGWPSAVDATKYYTFAVTPEAGCSVTLTALAVDVKASSTGPASGDVATSADAFAKHSTAFGGTATANVTVATSGATGAIEVRLYGYGASTSGGTFRIQNTLTLSGTVK